MYIIINNIEYRSDNVETIPPEHINLLQEAINSVEPNKMYSVITYQGHTIEFMPQIFVRASSKHTGKHQILERKKALGQGQFGVVSKYKKLFLEPQEQKTKDSWVIKQVKLQSEYDKEKFRKECSLTKMFFPELIFNEEQGYLVMPNVGMEFHSNVVEELDPKELPYSMRVNALRKILLSLNEIHNRGVIHHDLKLQNVCVKQTDYGETLRVIDFGLSSEVMEDTISLGTPVFAAPEKYKSPYFANEKSDLFSYGFMLLFTMVGINKQTENDPKVGVLGAHVFIVLEKLLPEPKSAQSNDAKQIARQNFEKMRKTDFILGALDEEEILKIIDLYAEPYQQGKLLDTIKTNLKAFLDNNTGFIPAHQRAFFTNFFEKATLIDIGARADIDQLMFGQALMLISENQAKFLKGDIQHDKLQDWELLFLKIMMLKANSSNKLLDIYQMHILGDLETNLKKLEQINCIEVLMSIPKTESQKHILAKVFDQELRVLDPSFDTSKYPLPPLDDPLKFAGEAKNYIKDLKASAATLFNRGLKFQHSDLERILNDTFMKYFTECSESMRLDFFRLLPQEQQNHIRTVMQKESPDMLFMLQSGFQTKINNQEQARALLKRAKPNNFIIYYDKSAKCYHLAYLTQDKQLTIKPLTSKEKQFFLADKAYSSMKELIDQLTDQEIHYSPLVEMASTPLSSPKFFDQSVSSGAKPPSDQQEDNIPKME